jgi:flavorubredoxin
MVTPRVLCVLPAAPAAVACLSSQLDPRELTHLVITHVGPNRTPTIAAVLRAALMGRPAGSRLKLVASNPAIKVLRSGLAGESRGRG